MYSITQTIILFHCCNRHSTYCGAAHLVLDIHICLSNQELLHNGSVTFSAGIDKSCTPNLGSHHINSHYPFKQRE